MVGEPLHPPKVGGFQLMTTVGPVWFTGGRGPGMLPPGSITQL
jgi:hypothetical protein